MKEMVCLSKEEILRIDNQSIFIMHRKKGMWWDIADGVSTMLDIDDLYLSGSDTWLDCNEYGYEWVAYRKSKKDANL